MLRSIYRYVQWPLKSTGLQHPRAHRSTYRFLTRLHVVQDPVPGQQATLGERGKPPPTQLPFTFHLYSTHNVSCDPLSLWPIH